MVSIIVYCKQQVIILWLLEITNLTHQKYENKLNFGPDQTVKSALKWGEMLSHLMCGFSVCHIFLFFFSKNRFDQLIVPFESTYSRRKCEQHKPSEEDLGCCAWSFQARAQHLCFAFVCSCSMCYYYCQHWLAKQKIKLVD